MVNSSRSTSWSSVITRSRPPRTTTESAPRRELFGLAHVMVPAPLTVRCCLRSSRGPALPLDWYEGGGRWMRIRRKRGCRRRRPHHVALARTHRVRGADLFPRHGPLGGAHASREVRRPLFPRSLVARRDGARFCLVGRLGRSRAQSRGLRPHRGRSPRLSVEPLVVRAPRAGLRLHGAGVLLQRDGHLSLDWRSSSL